MMKKVTITQSSTKATIDGYIWANLSIGVPFILYKPAKGLDKYKKVLTTSNIVDIIDNGDFITFRTLEDQYTMVFANRRFKGDLYENTTKPNYITIPNYFGSC